MKNILTYILIILGFTTTAQTNIVKQKTEFEKIVVLDDSVTFSGLLGAGSYVVLDAQGNARRGVSLGSTTLTIDSVFDGVSSLRSVLLGKQDTLVALSCLEISNDTIFIDSLCLANFIINVAGSGGDSTVAGVGLGKSGNELYVSDVPQDSITGLSDSLNARQRGLVAGTGITISGDTISASGTDTDWTESGNYVTNTTDSIGIGTASPVKRLDVSGAAAIQNLSSDTALEVFSASGTGITAYSGTGTALAVNAGLAGKGFSLNGYEVDEISNDTLLAGQDSLSLVTEWAVKRYVDNNAGGGGSTYFAGTPLTLSNDTFLINDGDIPLSKLQSTTGNAVLVSSGASIFETVVNNNSIVGRGLGGLTTLGLSGNLGVSPTSNLHSKTYIGGDNVTINTSSSLIEPDTITATVTGTTFNTYTYYLDQTIINFNSSIDLTVLAHTKDTAGTKVNLLEDGKCYVFETRATGYFNNTIMPDSMIRVESEVWLAPTDITLNNGDSVSSANTSIMNLLESSVQATTVAPIYNGAGALQTGGGSQVWFNISGTSEKYCYSSSENKPRVYLLIGTSQPVGNSMRFLSQDAFLIVREVSDLDVTKEMNPTE